MALPASMHRFHVELSHVDRGVYESLDLRIARHPSEGLPFLVARVIAYCHCHQEGINFSRGGVSSTEEPALVVRDLTGQLKVWIEVGVPSAERVHKASKRAGRVVIFAHRSPANLHRDAQKRSIHQVEQVELYPLDPGMLENLGAQVGRTNNWTVLINDGHLYVTVADTTFDASLVPVPI